MSSSSWKSRRAARIPSGLANRYDILDDIIHVMYLYEKVSFVVGILFLSYGGCFSIKLYQVLFISISYVLHFCPSTLKQYTFCYFFMSYMIIFICQSYKYVNQTHILPIKTHFHVYLFFIHCTILTNYIPEYVYVCTPIIIHYISVSLCRIRCRWDNKIIYQMVSGGCSMDRVNVFISLLQLTQNDKEKNINAKIYQGQPLVVGCWNDYVIIT